MKRIIILVALVGTATLTIAQQHRRDSLLGALTTAGNEKGRSEALLQLADYYSYRKVDSTAYFLRQLWHNSHDDSLKVRALSRLSSLFRYTRPDSTLYYANLGLRLARANGFIQEEVTIMNDIALTETVIGNFSKALQLSLQAIKICDKHDLPTNRAFSQSVLALVYSQTGSYDRSILNYKKVLEYYYVIDDPYIGGTQAALSEVYADLGQRDSAIFYAELALQSKPEPSYFTIDLVASAYNKLGDIDKSLKYYHLSIHSDEMYLAFKGNLAIAKIYQRMNKPDSALFFGVKAIEIANESGFYSNIIEGNSFMSDFYRERSPAQALGYARDAIVYKDSLMEMERSMSVDDLISIDEEQRKNEIAAAEKEFRYKLRMNAMLGSSFTLLVVAALLYRSRRQSKKAKKNIEAAYDKLKATQSQLVQAEKMASLGELTAGIAHEIQNPLNFVNNFSEVSNELLSEMKTELSSGNPKAATEIANVVSENMAKIMHHGKRADGIVKGMLQHSRTSSGIKEPTDINGLCDEYVRLAYHGLRAKDSSFNVKIRTELDETVGKINIVTQDIGRVILNLINNAFYAVSEKAKRRRDYEPVVSVITKRLSEKVLIIVKDNGDGVPADVIGKIFQPFFTTKPTGQGTGLGLSLSYDIVKSHGGDLNVETKEGEGSEFVVSLPIV